MTHGPLGQPITAHSRNLKLPNYPYSRKALLKLNQQLSKLKNLILDSIITKITYERCQESLILKLDQKSWFFWYLILFFLELFLVCATNSIERNLSLPSGILKLTMYWNFISVYFLISKWKILLERKTTPVHRCSLWLFSWKIPSQDYDSFLDKIKLKTKDMTML